MSAMSVPRFRMSEVCARHSQPSTLNSSQFKNSMNNLISKPRRGLYIRALADRLDGSCCNRGNSRIRMIQKVGQAWKCFAGFRSEVHQVTHNERPHLWLGLSYSISNCRHCGLPDVVQNPQSAACRSGQLAFCKQLSQPWQCRTRLRPENCQRPASSEPPADASAVSRVNSEEAITELHWEGSKYPDMDWRSLES